MTARPSDTLPLTCEIDADAEPGDVVGALARLLVEVVEAERAEDSHGRTRHGL